MPEEVAGDGRPCFFKFITAITRAWGLITIAVLWFFAVEAVYQKNNTSYTSWYLIGISPLVTFLELVWIFNKCACCADEGCCCRIWRLFLWIDGWKKTILYFLLAIPCFTKGIVALWAVLYGLILIILGIVYLLKSIKYSSCIEKQRNVSTDQQRSTLVKNELPPGTSGTPVLQQRAPNPDWPPPGYAQGPDGSIYAVANETAAENPKEKQDEKQAIIAKQTETHSVKSKQTVDNPKLNYGAVEQETRDWPPPGYAIALDGTVYAVSNEHSQGTRQNPFNRSIENEHQNSLLTQSTDSYNPFDAQ